MQKKFFQKYYTQTIDKSQDLCYYVSVQNRNNDKYIAPNEVVEVIFDENRRIKKFQTYTRRRT